MKIREFSKKHISDNHGNAVIAVVAVIAVLVVLIAAFLLLKNPVSLKLAQAKAESNDFDAAVSLLNNVETDEAETLSDYASLRSSINSKYPTLLGEFNINTFRRWQKKAADIAEDSDLLPDSLRTDAVKLSESLDLICQLYDDYYNILPEINNLMTIFEEINRLYTKDADGNNISFTIAGEREKIQNWETYIADLQNFTDEIPNGSSVYLLNYLIKESTGECNDLSTSMNTISDKGYGDYDSVRVTGTNEKTFPSVEGANGISVNVADKDEYISYMEIGIFRALTETLAEYYSG